MASKTMTFLQNTSTMNAVCICCTSKNCFLINIMTCSHASFLENLIKFKPNSGKWYVCVLCHNMLKKIEIFKKQVEESVEMFMEQVQVLKVSKLHDLNYTQTVTVDVTASESHAGTNPESMCSVHVDLSQNQREATAKRSKSETIKKESIPEKTWEVKIEQEVTFDYECAPLPSANEKPASDQEDEKYKDKIAILVLNEDRLQEEREKLRKSESYLKFPYKCDSCIVGFDHEDTLKRHVDGKHKMKNSEFTCNVCLSVLNSKMSYSSHMRRHYKRFACLKCGKLFNHLISAEQHYNVTHASPDAAIQSTYTCKYCNFDTNSYRVYRHHLDKHKGKRECKLCGKEYVNMSGLRIHMNNVHNKRPGEYKCTHCEKTYSAKSGLLAHVRTVHSTAARPSCDVCKTQYLTIQALRHHLRTHSKHVTESDKKFVCDECGAKFAIKKSLRVHITWEHMGLTVQCSQCPKSFKSESRLRRHVRFVHEKTRPPRNKICQYCGNAFTTNTTLKSHIRTHTGEKPLHCDQCPSKFAHSAALYTHKKLIHNKKNKIQ